MQQNDTICNGCLWQDICCDNGLDFCTHFTPTDEDTEIEKEIERQRLGFRAEWGRYIR